MLANLKKKLRLFEVNIFLFQGFRCHWDQMSGSVLGMSRLLSPQGSNQSGFNRLMSLCLLANSPVHQGSL